MKRVTLINPNTSHATTAMMVRIAKKYAPAGIAINGVTVAAGVPMILTEAELSSAGDSVVEVGLAAISRSDGLIVGAFGDPGLEQLAALSGLPTVGICQASMLEASAGGRSFGIATVTPKLVASFTAKADRLGVLPFFTGTQLTDGDPLALTADPRRLRAALEEATRRCFAEDKAEAVIIGGGPLGEAADDLQQLFSQPVIAPIRSAVKLLSGLIADPAQARVR